MLEWTREQWNIIFLGIAVLVQWGIIINILGKMERLRHCMHILNKQNKSLKEYVEDQFVFNVEQHKEMARNIKDLCTLTKYSDTCLVSNKDKPHAESEGSYESNN